MSASYMYNLNLILSLLILLNLCQVFVIIAGSPLPYNLGSPYLAHLAKGNVSFLTSFGVRRPLTFHIRWAIQVQVSL